MLHIAFKFKVCITFNMYDLLLGISYFFILIHREIIWNVMISKLSKCNESKSHKVIKKKRIVKKNLRNNGMSLSLKKNDGSLSRLFRMYDSWVTLARECSDTIHYIGRSRTVYRRFCEDGFKTYICAVNRNKRLRPNWCIKIIGVQQGSRKLEYF